MESTQELKIQETKKIERQQEMEQWLRSACHLPSVSLQFMAGDASFRRYFRLADGDKTMVVMDAPPPVENCRPYIAIASALRQTGLNAPEVIHADVTRGFLLMTDFGDATYLKTLTAANADKLYGAALNALSILQGCRSVENHKIPPFTADFMLNEWMLHKEWVWHKLLGLSSPFAEKELDACYALLVESAVNQPQVFMHRDYHAGNLMVLPEGGVGILDFQDAFIGPVTYDLASLLRDCYVEWPREQVEHWALSYRQRLNLQTDAQAFLRWFDLMGMQRHLKALMTFARKHVRDQQPRYLLYIPRTLNYLLQVSHRYPEFERLHDYLRVTIKPAFERIMK
jgi:aminoglycoside/choline kinase family phosphotransferase